MSPAERRRARLAALRAAATRLERELAAVRAELRRAERVPVLRLHRGLGIPAPACASCGGPTSRSVCWRCGAVAPAEAAR